MLTILLNILDIYILTIFRHISTYVLSCRIKKKKKLLYQL